MRSFATERNRPMNSTFTKSKSSTRQGPAERRQDLSNPRLHEARPRASCSGQDRAVQAARVKELPLDYMPSKEFKRATAAERILAPTPEAPASQRKVKRPGGLPPYLA